MHTHTHTQALEKTEPEHCRKPNANISIYLRICHESQDKIRISKSNTFMQQYFGNEISLFLFPRDMKKHILTWEAWLYIYINTYIHTVYIYIYIHTYLC
jgi:hypothetical protein